MKRTLPTLLLALALPQAAAATQGTVAICASGPDEARAAGALDRWVPTARVELRPPPCPTPAPGRFTGIFRRQGDEVWFRLAGPEGWSLERVVPWLAGPEAPLESLEKAGRLSEFSVLLEALLAEHRLEQAWALPVVGPPLPGTAPVEVAAQGEPPAPAAAPAAREKRGGVAAKGRSTAPARRTTGRPAPGGQGATAAVTQPGPTAGAGGPPDGQQAPTPSGAVGPSAPAEPAASAAATAAAAPPTVAEPELPPAGGLGSGGAAAAGPGSAEAGTPAPALPVPGQEPEALEFRAPPPPGWQPRLGAAAGLRLRTPGIVGPEVAVGAELGPLYARGAWQPPTRWELLGLPLDLEVWGGEVGWLGALAAGGGWELRAGGGLAAEWVAVVPRYVEGGRTRSSWDAGAVLAGRWAWQPVEGLGLAGQLAVQYSPTARTNRVGDDGPAARVNALSARLGIEIAWPR